MAKSREKTQQLGFWDPEVSTPDHDTVCLWAYKNADLIFREAYPDLFDHSWLKEEMSINHTDESTVALAKEFSVANPRPNPRITQKTLEFVLSTHTGYRNNIERIVGYADLLIKTELPRIYLRYKSSETRGGEDVFDDFILGWTHAKESPEILVEAKSILPTVGELMRQIQLYRTAFFGRIVVVSPDEKYADILSEQNITFVKYCKSGEE